MIGQEGLDRLSFEQALALEVLEDAPAKDPLPYASITAFVLLIGVS